MCVLWCGEHTENHIQVCTEHQVPARTRNLNKIKEDSQMNGIFNKLLAIEKKSGLTAFG